MKIREVAIGQTFRFVDKQTVYVALDTWSMLSGMMVSDLATCLVSNCIISGAEEVEIVSLLPIVLESEDLKTLDRLIEIEGENEDRASRITRLLEGAGGAILAEAMYY